jgi:hypothetical protein
MISRRLFIGTTAAGLLAIVIPGRQTLAAPARVEVYMSRSCGCCGEWVKHMRASGFEVNAQYVDDVTAVKRRHGVPEALWSCHTGIIGGHVIEGHVPAADIQRLLADAPKVRNAVRGLAVPGMPVGAPGMEQGPAQPYATMAFGKEGSRVFARH